MIMRFSAIIATLDDGYHLGASLKRLRQISEHDPLEVVVVDGGSRDDTVVQARAWADQVLVHERANRGEQLHLGAQKASGNLLLFLRADTQLPGNWQQALEHFWLAPGLAGVSATAFTVDFGVGWPYRAASWLANAEARWRGLADLRHGLCTTAELYRQSGGFPPWPSLEGRALCQRLAPLGRVVLLPETARSSASRLHRFGLLGCARRRLWLELRLKFGADPAEVGRDGPEA